MHTQLVVIGGGPGGYAAAFSAADEGLLVLLDNHRLNDQAIPELWYGDGYTDQDWINAWVLLAERYADQDNVIGADLKNEPHGGATWGTGDVATDWRLAAQRGGNAVLGVSPHWLIVVEGIGGNIAGQQLPSHWWGGNLEGVANWPVVLDVDNRLVYSPHEYGQGVFDQPWFSDPDMAGVLAHRWETGFAYIAEQDIAPILVGEFGGREVGYDTTEGLWQNQFVDFLAERGYSWTYWSWNPNSTDTGGILDDDWVTVHADKQVMLDRLLDADPGEGGGATSTTTTTTLITTTTSPAATTTSTLPPGGLTAAIEVTEDWGSGYCAQFAITNATSQDETGLGLDFELVDATISSTWNGTATVTEATIGVVLEPWGQSVEAGVTEENFGYCASRTDDQVSGAFPTSLAVCGSNQPGLESC
jgi:endoglucanase